MTSSEEKKEKNPGKKLQVGTFVVAIATFASVILTILPWAGVNPPPTEPFAFKDVDLLKNCNPPSVIEERKLVDCKLTFLFAISNESTERETYITINIFYVLGNERTPILTKQPAIWKHTIIQGGNFMDKTTELTSQPGTLIAYVTLLDDVPGVGSAVAKPIQISIEIPGDSG